MTVSVKYYLNLNRKPLFLKGSNRLAKCQSIAAQTYQSKCMFINKHLKATPYTNMQMSSQINHQTYARYT